MQRSPAKQHSRRKALGYGLALFAPGAAANSSQPALSALGSLPPPSAPMQLTVAAFPAIDQVVKDFLPHWKKQYPNIEVRVVSRQFVDHHTAMTTALSTSIYLPDVMALEVSFLGRFAQGGGLDVLSAPRFPLMANRARFTQYAFDQTLNRKGEPVAVPADLGPGTLLYRKDLLEKAGLDETALTRSWDDFVQAGLRIKASSNAYLVAHARDIKDILIRVGLRTGEGLYFDRNSGVLVNTPRFERAFTLARTIRQNKLDARVPAWSNEWTEGFRRNALATQLTGAWLAGHLNNWLAPSTKGLWRAAQLPEQSWAAYGGTFYAIPRKASAASKPYAWELIRQLTHERNQQLAAFRSQDAFPALIDAQDDNFFDEPIAFLGGQKARLIWREAARRVTAVPVHKQDAFADEVINTELDKVLDRGKDISSALNDAQRLLEKRAHR